MNRRLERVDEYLEFRASLRRMLEQRSRLKRTRLWLYGLRVPCTGSLLMLLLYLKAAISLPTACIVSALLFPIGYSIVLAQGRRMTLKVVRSLTKVIPAEEFREVLVALGEDESIEVRRGAGSLLRELTASNEPVAVEPPPGRGSELGPPW